MFSSLARLVKNKIKTMGPSRNLQEAVNADMPQIVSVSEESSVTTAARLLLNGKVIGIPTDTIYGIAVSAQNNNGIKSLYEIKKRDSSKPIAICVGNVNEVHLYGETSHLNSNMLECLLPGAVTIVLKRKALLNLNLNPSTELVGIRIPKYPFVQNLARECGVPIALTSANLSSEQSPISVSEFRHLWPCLGGVFDGGVLGGSREGSTVINLSEPGYFTVIRSGSALESTRREVKKFGLIEKHLV